MSQVIATDVMNEQKSTLLWGSSRLFSLVYAALTCVIALGLWVGSATLAPNTARAQDTGPVLELHGYFRFRGDIFQNMALGSAPGVPPEDVTSPGYTRPTFFWFPFYYPTSAYTPLNGNDYRTQLRANQQNEQDFPRTLASGNMRLRLKATLRVGKDIKIFTTIDVLDNLVMGSTPRGFNGQLQDPFAPLIGLSDTQFPPESGVNAMLDSIRVRHAYAHILTPVGVIRAGRMPSHWGLGLLANKGMGLNNDYGDTVDRVMFITKLFNHLIIPGFDFLSSGPISTRPQQTRYIGQPFDLDPADDARQVLLAIARVDRGNDLRNKMEDGELIVNYGVYAVYRWQNLTSECDPNSTCTNRDLDPSTAVNNAGRHPAEISLTNRGAQLGIFDAWFRLIWSEKLRIEAEFVVIVGEVANAPNGERLNILQYGGALEFEYSFLQNALQLGINVGIASGDNDFFSRWGFTFDTDNKINNFRFDPDYQVDMILWREMYGTITNAFYAKAMLTYNFDGNPWREGVNGIGIRVAGIYSHALIPEATLGQAAPLGVELNAHVKWASKDGYSLAVDYGILFPLPGLSFAEIQNGQRVERMAAGIAQRIQIRLGVNF